MEFTKGELQVWLKEQLKDLVADKKHIDESDMPLFNKGMDWVCALDTKVEKILDKLVVPDMHEALKAIVAEGTQCCQSHEHPIREIYNFDMVDRLARQALAKAEGK